MSHSVTTRALGAEIEAKACHYLQQQGLQLIQKNFTTRLGEIDLIMQDQDTLVFVEVRYRKTQHFGGALESITHSKKVKLHKAVQAYLQMTHSTNTQSVRVDVLAASGSDSLQWQWLKNISLEA